MHFKRVVSVVALATVLTTGAFARTSTSPVVPLLQVVSPDAYPKLSVEQRQFYVAGALDSDRVFFEQTQPLFAACLEGMTVARATDIVDRSLAGMEPMLRSSMPIAVHNALLKDCNRRGFKAN